MPDFEALDRLTAHLRQTQMAADRRLTEVAARLAWARRVVALTGAGISVASGIGTYRGAGGMWENPELLEAHQVESLPGSLPIIWSVKGPMRARALAARPNPAHLALVKLEARLVAAGGELTVVTQNIDGLHQRAGSTRVLEMHGSMMRSRCSGPNCSLPPFEDTQVPDPSELPTCPRCQWQPLRPDVVLFGEPLPWPVIAEAESALHRADMLLVIGTSGAVSSATSTIDSAAAYGVHCVLINKEPWERPHPDVAETLIGPAEEILPQVVALSESPTASPERPFLSL
jgi:NAD-dependent deacetylase